VLHPFLEPSDALVVALLDLGLDAPQGRVGEERLDVLARLVMVWTRFRWCRTALTPTSHISYSTQPRSFTVRCRPHCPRIGQRPPRRRELVAHHSTAGGERPPRSAPPPARTDPNRDVDRAAAITARSFICSNQKGTVRPRDRQDPRRAVASSSYPSTARQNGITPAHRSRPG